MTRKASNTTTARCVVRDQVDIFHDARVSYTCDRERNLQTFSVWTACVPTGATTRVSTHIRGALSTLPPIHLGGPSTLSNSFLVMSYGVREVVNCLRCVSLPKVF